MGSQLIDLIDQRILAQNIARSVGKGEDILAVFAKLYRMFIFVSLGRAAEEHYIFIKLIGHGHFIVIN
ncbi:hypothetical protein SDC9_202291 [bioreactor metagenome]|uniref:Uncharacterized protein n=1 Tax=bioreactor metagenome TaxID=1076179 RepID=A0A645IUR3_9ZZZZ